MVSDLVLQSPAILIESGREWGAVDVFVKHKRDERAHGMIEANSDVLTVLLHALVHGLPKGYFLLLEGICTSLPHKEVELLVIEVFTEADVVDCVGKRALKLLRDVNAGRTVSFDLG